jgi:hypothetical protein
MIFFYSPFALLGACPRLHPEGAEGKCIKNFFARFSYCDYFVQKPSKTGDF